MNFRLQSIFNKIYRLQSLLFSNFTVLSSNNNKLIFNSMHDVPIVLIQLFTYNHEQRYTLTIFHNTVFVI